MQPAHIYHCDWGKAAQKRWSASAILKHGRYTLSAAGRIDKWAGEPKNLIPAIRRNLNSLECALVGFDFPIGIPARYARTAGIKEFKALLLQLGAGPWSNFFDYARRSEEISLRRPFYPFKPGGTKQSHLLRALGFQNMDQLRRQCEEKQPERRAACSLFWTLGANQVSRGAIVGWRDVLAPALKNSNDVLFRPFDGKIPDLLQPGKIVIAETYPTEYYRWFSGSMLNVKGQRHSRTKFGDFLLNRAAKRNLELEGPLHQQIEKGFPEGDDAFDAVVGLFGMIEVATGERQSGEPHDEKITRWEGWILGQTSLQ
ncbi:MAG TPA: hypothetical protein VLA42_03260 [Verrucomicrobiae bacterium]|jgi:hypothetical protein|nr:hypothetical protein [Verrucomicrobiae bacterium]